MDRSRRNENMFIVKRHIPMNRACRVRSIDVKKVNTAGLKTLETKGSQRSYREKVRYALGGPSVFYQNRGMRKLISAVWPARQNCYREKVNTVEHP